MRSMCVFLVLTGKFSSDSSESLCLLSHFHDCSWSLNTKSVMSAQLRSSDGRNDVQQWWDHSQAEQPRGGPITLSLGLSLYQEEVQSLQHWCLSHRCLKHHRLIVASSIITDCRYCCLSHFAVFWIFARYSCFNSNFKLTQKTFFIFSKTNHTFLYKHFR